MDQGIDGGRIDIVSFGEEQPAVQGQSEDAFALNRRAEFEITAGGENLVPPR
jgi:peptidoglycan-associated lipoprotein